jgi:hypothetical protein
MLCDGKEYNAFEYVDLFEDIGTVYVTGSGTNITFSKFQTFEEIRDIRHQVVLFPMRGKTAVHYEGNGEG